MQRLKVGHCLQIYVKSILVIFSHSSNKVLAETIRIHEDVGT